MNILIKGSVMDENDESRDIMIDEHDIEKIIIEKAREKEIKPRKGRLLTHFDPSIDKIIID